MRKKRKRESKSKMGFFARASSFQKFHLNFMSSKGYLTFFFENFGHLTFLAQFLVICTNLPRRSGSCEEEVELDLSIARHNSKYSIHYGVDPTRVCRRNIPKKLHTTEEEFASSVSAHVQR